MRAQDRVVRRLVSGLRGVARDAAILDLLTHPERYREALKRDRAKRSREGRIRFLHIHFRASPEEYLMLKAAVGTGQMSAFIRRRLGLS